MRFLIDAQLPKLLSDYLRELGHDCLHTLDLPEGNRTPDAFICELADREGYVVVTKDSDFVDSHHLRKSPAKLLLVSTGNIGNRQLLGIVANFSLPIAQALADSSFVELTRDGLAVHG